METKTDRTYYLKNNEILGSGLIMIEQGLTKWWKLYQGANPSGSPKRLSSLIETRTKNKRETIDKWYLTQLEDLTEEEKRLIIEGKDFSSISNTQLRIKIKVSSNSLLRILIKTLGRNHKYQDILTLINKLIFEDKVFYKGWTIIK